MRLLKLILLFGVAACSQGPRPLPKSLPTPAEPAPKQDNEQQPAPTPPEPDIAECLKYPLIPEKLPTRIGHHYFIQSRNEVNCQGQRRGALDVLVGGLLTPDNSFSNPGGGRRHRWLVTAAAWDDDGFTSLLGRHGLSSLIRRYSAFESGARVEIKFRPELSDTLQALVSEDEATGALYLNIRVASASREDLLLNQMLSGTFADGEVVMMSVDHSYFGKGFKILGRSHEGTLFFGEPTLL